jgi:hypothetical protein
MAIVTAAGSGDVIRLGLIVLVVNLGRGVPFSRRLRASAKVLLPVLVAVGKLAGLKREQVQHAFVAVNNELVLAQCRNGRTPKSVLLLMPHCLKDKDCQVKITYRVENCKRCSNAE